MRWRPTRSSIGEMVYQPQPANRGTPGGNENRDHQGTPDHVHLLVIHGAT